ncbi:MAG: threonine--tRNA ligase, partial [Candidatus Sericytochromatia bacterium]
MLQRIYGTAWKSKEDLDKYLFQLEEAKKRDHRKLGKELELFMMHPYAPGCVFWLPKGNTMFQLLSNKIREYNKKNGYVEVRTPQLFKKDLWETSGHWEHYKENMFNFENEEETFSLKAMNCPSHMLIFKNKLRSYKDLPLRVHDQGVLHRNEVSGALSGLTRVRMFSQDDAHLFVTEENLKQEISSIMRMIKRIYTVFDMTFKVVLSTRPEQFMGSPEFWDMAEKTLEEAIIENGLEYSINHGDGAFYGPKIDYLVSDALGREHQTATTQLDLQLPRRFDLTYVDKDNSYKHPIVIHRAMYGSFERFMGILIEHYAGHFPTWLAPVQCTVINISDRHLEYAQKVVSMYLSHLEKETKTTFYGLIGYQIFKDYDLLFDYRKNTITFIKPESTKEFLEKNYKSKKHKEIPIQMGSHLAIVDAYINGKKYSFGIDCGAESNLLDLRLKDELISNFSNIKTDSLSGANKESVETTKGALNLIEIGGVKFKKTETCFSDISHLNDG